MLNPISANSVNLSFANVGDVAFIVILPNEHFSFAQYDLIMFSASVLIRTLIVILDLLVKTGAETPQKQENATL